MYLRIVFVFSLLIFHTNAFCQFDQDSLDRKLNKIQDLGYLPGFAVAIVNADGVLYENGFGYADMSQKSPFSIHTLQNIGSVSKTLLGISLMQLVEAGKISLDSPINDFLPFAIYNPHYPEEEITIGHLASHTSSLKDPWEYEKTYLFEAPIKLTKQESPKGFYKYVKLYNSNQEMPIDQFIRAMIHPDGEWYRKKNFLRKKPGETYHYSNLGAAICGIIVEQVTGQSFQEYTKTKIIEPLKMEHTGWERTEFSQEQFASLYLSNDRQIPAYSLISYADGGLITNVHDLGRFFAAMIKGYQGGHGLLNPTSFQAMMNPYFKSDKRNSAVFWEINGKGEIGHSGGDPGIMTYMLFDPNTGIGRVVFTNKYDPEGNGINQVVYIWKTLEAYIDANFVEPEGEP